MTIAAIIVAAGRGVRAGGDVPKQWQMLAGVPVLTHSIRAFAGVAEIGAIVMVVHPQDMGRVGSMVQGRVSAVCGGATRAASVCAGLEALEGRGVSHVMIHDGARPLISAALIRRLIAAMTDCQAVAPALPVTDALWRSTGDQSIPG